MAAEYEDQKITLSIEADTSGVKKAEGDLKKFAEEVESVSKSITRNTAASKKLVRAYEEISRASQKRINKNLQSIIDAQYRNKAGGARDAAKAFGVDPEKEADKLEKFLEAANKVQNTSLRDFIDSSFGASGKSAAESAKAFQEMSRQRSFVESTKSKDYWKDYEDRIQGRDHKTYSAKDSAFAQMLRDEEAQAKETAKVVAEEAKRKAAAEKQAAQEAAQAQAQAQKRAAAFRSSLQKVAGAAMSAGKSIGSRLTSKIKDFGRKLVEPIKKATEFFSAIKRIALYRGIRTALKEITQGFAEGTRNLYDWSALGEGHFKAVMDGMASSFLYLKNSIGAAAAPLVGAFASALDVIVDKAVAVINVLNQLFARLTGQSFWYKAKKVATEYADSANGAAKATRNQLMAFDELNNITTSDGGGGGGGAVGSDWFSKEELEEDQRTIVQRINDFVDSIDSESLGKRLGEKINAALQKIDDFLVGVHWKQIGWKVADFLVNAIETTDFTLLGKTLADKINVSIGLASGFIDRLGQKNENGQTGWQTFGQKIGNLVNGWVQNVKWKDLGEAINGLAKGLGEMISEAFKTIEWEDVKQAIEDFFTGLGWEGALLLAAPLLGKGLIALLKAAFTIKSGSEAATLLTGVGTTMAGLILAGFLTGSVIESGAVAFKALAKTLSGDYAGAKQELAKLKTSNNPLVRFMDWTTDKVSDWILGNKEEVTGGLKDTQDEVEPIVAGVTSDWDNFYKDMDDKSTKIGGSIRSIGERSRETKQTNALATAGIASDWDLATTDVINANASWLDAMGDTQQGVKDTASSLGEIKTAVDELPDGKSVNVEVSTSGLDTANSKLKDMLKYLKEIGVKSTIHISASGNIHGGISGSFASGGYPTQGTYFLAGERTGEAEMVGTINGRTGVASGQEITGIAEAVYSTSESEMQAMQEQNNLLRALLNKNFTLAPSATLGRVNAQSAAMYARVTGA